MRAVEAVVSDTVSLRPLTESDITGRYLSWFRDERVTRYLEAKNLTRQEAIDHLRRGIESGDWFLYAICVDGLHIGNLKIGPIDRRHGLADLVTIIGDPDYWGRGYATEAVRQGVALAWSLGIRKLAAGIWSDNIGSVKAYTRAGFTIEATLRDHYLLNGKPQDRVCVSAWNPACKISNCPDTRDGAGRINKR